MSRPNGALQGIRVLDLSRILGGPLCGQILGDHGADVLKVEPPQGDDTRAWGPPFQDGVSSYYRGLNRNKRLQFLDLSQPEGQQAVLALMEQVDVRAVSHITGGGFYENIPRALAAGCVAKLEKKSLRMPPIFPLLQKVGKIPERDMFNTFNMGVGMAVVVPGDRADESVRILKEAGEDAYILGEIAKGAEKGVELC